MIPKAEWGDGPWQNEPDATSNVDIASGYICDSVREMEAGHWCGYVCVPKGHAWYGVETFGSVPVNVHRGLSWARHYSPFDPETRDALWWFGFDCAHSRDYKPGHAAFLKSVGAPQSQYDPPPSAYRDLNYVREQCVLLAVQLKALASWRRDEQELFDADPNCEHDIKCASGGGVKCIKCGGWFCY